MNELKPVWSAVTISSASQLIVEINVCWQEALEWLSSVSSEDIDAISALFVDIDSQGDLQEAEINCQAGWQVVAVKKLLGDDTVAAAQRFMGLQALANPDVPVFVGTNIRMEIDYLNELADRACDGSNEALDCVLTLINLQLCELYPKALVGTTSRVNTIKRDNNIRDISRVGGLLCKWSAEASAVWREVPDELSKDALLGWQKVAGFILHEAIAVCRRENEEREKMSVVQKEIAKQIAEAKAEAAAKANAEREAKEAEARKEAERIRLEEEAKKKAELEEKRRKEAEAKAIADAHREWQERENRRMSDWEKKENARKQSYEDERQQRQDLRRQMQTPGEVVSLDGVYLQVLTANHEYALVLSQELQGKMAMHNRYAPISWKNCDLRAYLNGEYLDSLSPTIRDRLVAAGNDVNLTNQVDQENQVNVDQVFLLCEQQVRVYFDNNEQRIARLDGDAHHWWLRLPDANVINGAYVSDAGSIAAGGTFVDDPEPAIRPAMWLNNCEIKMPDIADWQGGPTPKPEPEPEPPRPQSCD